MKSEKLMALLTIWLSLGNSYTVLTDRQTKTGRTNGRNYTNVERNLAMMAIYLLVKFEFDWTKCFRVRVWNYTNLERNLAMMVIYLPVKFEFDWTKRFRDRVPKRKC